MPSLAEISWAWEWLGPDVIRSVFPNLRCFDIGWGEPFCFRCGWLAPTPEAADYEGLDTAAAINKAWNAASGWLERAHLQDHERGGDEDAWNLVPLCVLCHEEQPICETRDEGITFVNSRPTHAPLVRIAQVVTDVNYREVVRPGRPNALRAMLRAYARAGVIAAEAMGRALDPAQMLVDAGEEW